jgi:hypothetical protein
VYLEFNGSRSVLIDFLEAEGIDGDDGYLLRLPGESKFGDEWLCSSSQFVLLDFLLGQSAPEADVDHDIPAGEVHVPEILYYAILLQRAPNKLC